MLFSIIVPTYNRAPLISKTIQSVLNQEYAEFELLIIDDGSTDNTQEVVEGFNDKRIKYFKKENQERGAARNFGTNKAQGDFVTFLDSDDLFYPEHLKTAKEIISSNSSFKIFHIRFEIKDPFGNVISKNSIMEGDINPKLIHGNFLGCHSVFIERQIAKENLFNEDRKLAGLEDWELWLRMAPKFPIYYDNRITSAAINHDLRSVLNASKESLITKFDVLFSSILNNKEVLNYYRGHINAFKASCYTYIALHLALTKKYRMDTLRYLIMGIKYHPSELFKRRTLAIIKHIL